MKTAFLRLGVLSLSFFLALAARAEPGVDAGSIRIGQSVVLSGPMAENGVNYTNGIKLHLDQVNARGGVHGRKIDLATLDDAYDPKRTALNTQKLIEENKVFALLGYAGTGGAMAALPLVEKAQIPFIAPYTGADVLRKPGRWMFHLRASYGDEMLKMVEQLVTVGVKEIAVTYQDDNFGKAGLKSAEDALAKFGLKAVAQAPIDTNTFDGKQPADLIARSKPGAIIMATAGKASVAFFGEYLKTGQHPQFFGLSVVSATQLRKEFGTDAAGLGIAQVVPSPWSSKYAVVRQYREALAKAARQEPHHAGLEGYIAGKLLVEGLKRAGRDLTREKLVAALESMHNTDLGDYVVDYSPQKRAGSAYVDLSIIRTSGQFVQ